MSRVLRSVRLASGRPRDVFQRLLLLIGLWIFLAVLPATAAVAPEAGMLLVARPELPDPRFHETVILLVKHDRGGSAGLILNRPSRLPVSEVLPELTPGEGQTLAYGGPVASRAFLVLVLARNEPPEPAQKVVGKVYLTGLEPFRAWREKQRGEAVYQVFAGYGGWAPGQLAAEMVRGDWQLLAADEQTLFAPESAGLWQMLVKRAPLP